MIEIAGYPLTLPEAFLFLTASTFVFLVNLLFWLAVSYVVYILLFHFAKFVVRRVRGDIDDTIIDIIRVPALVILLTFGFAAALQSLPLMAVVSDWVNRLRNFIIWIAIVWAVWRLFGEVVIYYGKQHAKRSVDTVDDILLPIIEQFGRVIILVLGLFFILQQLGIDLTGVWIALGGAAFILAFALQDILSNMFASLAMLVDTPFKYGDFIELDGDIFRVERIGMRVTELYDTTAHTVIFMPNTNLTNEKLTNLTRPTIDLRTTIDFTLSDETDTRTVKQLLYDIAASHPNVLAPIPEKIEAMRLRLQRCYEMNEWNRVHGYIEEITRLSEEFELNVQIDALNRQIEQVADRVDAMEEDGLDDKEREVIRGELDGIRAQIDAMARQLTRWIMAVRYRMSNRLEGPNEPVTPEMLLNRASAYMGWVAENLGDELPVIGTLPEGDVSQLDVKRVVSKMLQRHGMEGFDKGFRDVENRRELENLIRAWDYRVVDLHAKLDELYDNLDSGNEQRLDDEVRKLEDWIHTDFRETTPEWKYPDASVKSIGTGKVTYQLEMQIDDINLEYFGRQSRVESEIRREVLFQCKEAGIKLA
jgi:MscS family membrane protein